MSPTFLSDIKASNKATLIFSILSGTDSKGSNGASVKTPRTNARSQEGTSDWQLVRNHLAPPKN